MKKLVRFLIAFIPIVVLVGVAAFSFRNFSGARAANCTPTYFYRDGINLTAALIDPPNPFSGTVNASGCNIGIYYTPGFIGTVNNAEVYGANYFGIVNNGAKLTITKSRIHNIGEVPFNGTQHGVGIYFAYDSGASGSITSNQVYLYQKGGIVVNGPSDSATVDHNTVTGMGPLNYIAQNGIQIGYGAKATVSNNTANDNSYTGPGLASSGGILVFGGPCYGGPYTLGTHVTNNTLNGNDVGIYASNLDNNTINPNYCIPDPLQTNVYLYKNLITNNAVNNTSGNGAPGQGYQAGISDQGNHDRIIDNRICGIGYTPVPNPPPYLYRIDVTNSIHPILRGNTSCEKGDVASQQSSDPLVRKPTDLRATK